MKLITESSLKLLDQGICLVSELSHSDNCYTKQLHKEKEQRTLQLLSGYFDYGSLEFCVVLHHLTAGL